jgi:hypothetical protein
MKASEKLFKKNHQGLLSHAISRLQILQTLTLLLINLPYLPEFNSKDKVENTLEKPKDSQLQTSSVKFTIRNRNTNVAQNIT